MKKILVLAFLLITLSAISQEMKFQKIDAFIESKVGEKDPGLAVGIVKDGKIIYEKYRGLSHLSYDIPFNEKTVSNIASAAKQFTALMVLELSLEGKLDLEEDIRKYFPTLYPNVSEEIKIRHLINHTSGIREYIGLMDMQGDGWISKVGLRNRHIIELLEQQEELAFSPDSQYEYSNSGYCVLAEIVAKVTGKRFRDYSKQFFEKLGMKDTQFPVGYMRVIPNKAEAYSDWGDGVWLQTKLVSRTAGEGFLYTTLKDQLIYEQAVQNAKLNNNLLLIPIHNK